MSWYLDGLKTNSLQGPFLMIITRLISVLDLQLLSTNTISLKIAVFYMIAHSLMAAVIDAWELLTMTSKLMISLRHSSLLYLIHQGQPARRVFSYSPQIRQRRTRIKPLPVHIFGLQVKNTYFVVLFRQSSGSESDQWFNQTLCKDPSWRADTWMGWRQTLCKDLYW